MCGAIARIEDPCQCDPAWRFVKRIASKLSDGFKTNPVGHCVL